MSLVRKLVMALGALAIAVSACGGGGGGSEDDDGGEYGSPLLTDTKPTVAPRATSAPTAAPRTTLGTRSAVTFAPPRTIPSGPGIDAVAKASEGSVGEFSPYLLRPSLTNKIVLELLLQDGLDAQAGTLNHITAELRKFSNNKTVVIERTSLPGGVTDWTVADLHRYADRYGKFKSGKSTAVLHVLFVHGGMAGSPGTLGVATRADVLTMFPDRYKSGSLSPTVVEDVVVTHEIGHILGLVDLYLNLGRGDFKDDPAPGGHHSPNKRSVMYYAADTSGIFSLFAGGPPREYDEADQKDLRAIRDGAARGSKGT